MLTFSNGLFYYECDISDNDLARRAGFAWDREHRRWATPYASVAEKVLSYGSTSKARELVNERMAAEKRNLYFSSATSSRFNVPAPKEHSYMPFQVAGISFLAAHENALLADQMGLGKTIQAIGFVNWLSCVKSVLIVCPASLKINWYNELKKWLIHKLSIGIATSKHWPETNIVICNYDILTKLPIKQQGMWDVLILDECHYLKNEKALRTKYVIGYRRGNKITPPIQAKRKLALTGTPILNRPIELYNILKYLSPYGWPTRFEYARRYCDAKQNGFGWDFSGSSNLDELQKKLRSTIMVRRMKKAVIKDLPDKRYQIIEIDEDKLSKVQKRSAAVWENLSKQLGIKDPSALSEEEYSRMVRALSGGVAVDFESISTLRKETALLKVPYVIEHLANLLENGVRVVCFAHHTEVIKELKNAFKGRCVTLTGETPMLERERAVRVFQDKSAPLFIGNIRAAGVGLTLTASSHVVFAESDWTPGIMEQAEDRTHRIGQKESVLVQHIVLRGSLDANMAKAVVGKKQVIQTAVDEVLDPELERLLE